MMIRSKSSQAKRASTSGLGGGGVVGTTVGVSEIDGAVGLGVCA